MTTQQRDRVLSILRSIRPECDFAGTNDFFAVGLLDSFDLTSLVVAIEEEFDVAIKGEDIVPEHFNNVGAIAALVDRYRAGGESDR
jgi:acyl carrier protein